MSAATRMPEELEAREPEPAEQARPQKLTVARMEKALRTDRRFSAAFGLAATITLGAEVVLKGLLKEIARDPVRRLFQPELQVASFPLGRVLAAAMGRLEREREVGEGLASLIAAGVVLEVDGGLTVDVDFEALTRPKAPARPPPRPLTVEALAALSPAERVDYERSLKDLGGRPRRGETRDQRSLRLFGVVQPRAAEASAGAETSGEVSEVSAKPVSSKPRGFGEEVLPKTSQTGFLGFEVSEYSPSAAAAESSQSRDSAEIQQQQSRQQDARAGDETSKPVSVETQVFGAEVSAENLDEMSGEVSGEASLPGSTPSIAVDVLVVQLIQILGTNGDRGTPPAVLAAEWLSYAGMTAGRILDIAREKRAKHEANRLKKPALDRIGSFNFIDAAVRQAAGLPERPAAAGAEAKENDSPTVLPPSLHRPWMNDTDRYHLATALRLHEEGNADALAKAIMRLQRTYPRVLGVLLEARPELAAAVAHARRAAGGS